MDGNCTSSSSSSWSEVEMEGRQHLLALATGSMFLGGKQASPACFWYYYYYVWPDSVRGMHVAALIEVVSRFMTRVRDRKRTEERQVCP